jgi:hypothetical protein
MRWACWGRDGSPDHRHMLGAKGVARADAEASRRHAAAIHAIAETVRVVCPWAANRARFACRRFNHVPYIRGHMAYTMMWVGRAGRIGACCCRRSSSSASPTNWTSCARQVRVHSSGSSNTCVRSHVSEPAACSVQHAVATHRLQQTTCRMQDTTCSRQHAAYNMQHTASASCCSTQQTPCKHATCKIHHATCTIQHTPCRIQRASIQRFKSGRTHLPPIAQCTLGAPSQSMPRDSYRTARTTHARWVGHCKRCPTDPLPTCMMHDLWIASPPTI